MFKTKRGLYVLFIRFWTHPGSKYLFIVQAFDHQSAVDKGYDNSLQYACMHAYPLGKAPPKSIILSPALPVKVPFI
jgi:hypothetical protein